MSVKLHFSSPADPSGINRSRSFTGFSSMPRRRSQGYSVTRSTSRTRMPLVKSTKNLGPPTKNISNLEPQPERVETIYKSLRKGLNEYLEADQNELDLLTMQQKDMKRNSRLAFLYDLDKQIRMTERYIRRLEFHISRIEELHESYCIQWRLRDGASNMKQAYNASPSTKGSRESLVQINRNFRECTERRIYTREMFHGYSTCEQIPGTADNELDMCTIERTLEIHLGEFHIRMKGLVGFARLCPGDQYEVLIRYGRQRWKLKGRIEADDRQMWDEEEVIFLPHINEDVEIKVAEMKGLMTVLVGTVTCESADFFTAQPQIMIVDVTELGTIKLQLEVMWNPFDSDELSVMSGSVNKYSVSRKSSLYNWTPPSTPSFRDKYFPQYFGQEDTLPPLHQDAKGTSIFNYLGNGNQNAHLSSVPENEKCHSYTNVEMEEKSCCVGDSAGVQRLSSELSGGAQEDILSVQPTNSPQTLQPDSPNQKQVQMDWTPGLAESVLHVGPQPSQQLSRGKPPELSSLDHIKTHTLGGSQLTPTHSSTRGNVTLVPPEKNTRADLISVNIGAILQDLLTDLRTVQISCKELKRLEQQFLHFRNSLKESSISRSESTVSLSVETALESFDFLNVDISEDTLSCFGSVRIKDERNSTHTKPNLCHHDLSSKNGDSGTKRKQPLALTSENHYLDQTLLTHLQMCRWLLQRFTSIGSIAILQNSILEELSQQILVLDTLAIIYHKKTENVRTVEEVIPKAQKVKLLSSFWRKCSGTESVLYSSAERFLTQLRNYYTQKVNAKCLGLSERVFRTLLHQIVGCCGFLLSASLSEEVLTIFQFFHYVKTYSITDLGTHLMKLTKEVSLAEALQTTPRVKTLKKLKGKPITEFQPLHQTLESISVLQLDENPKVTQAAVSFLSNASVHRRFRDKALAYYTDALQDKDLHIQKGACLALKHLKAVESIEQIVSLCQSEAEDVRDTARETVLSFGEKGNLALEKLERMWYDLNEDGIQNATTQITIL